MTTDPAVLVERAFREDQGAAVGSLVRAFGDLSLAEEALAPDLKRTDT